MLTPSAAVASRLRDSSSEPVYYIVISKSEGVVAPGSVQFWNYTVGSGHGATERTFTTGPVSWSSRQLLIDDYNLQEGRLSRRSIKDLVSKIGGLNKPGGLESTGSFAVLLNNTDGGISGANPLPAFSASQTLANTVPPAFTGRTVSLYLTFADITDLADSLLMFTGQVLDDNTKGDSIEIEIESRLARYDGLVPPELFENDRDDHPRFIDGEAIPLVYGAHDAAPGFLTAPVANKSSVDVGPVVKFADTDSGLAIDGLNKILYAEEGFAGAGPADIASGAPTGFSTYTPYMLDDANAEMGFTDNEIEEIYCFLVIRPGGQAAEALGAWVYATNPENAIDGDLSTSAETHAGPPLKILQLRLPSMSSSGSLVRNEGTGLSAAFVTLKADINLANDVNSRGWFYFSKAKDSVDFTDGLKIDPLVYADNGAVNNLGGAGQSKWQMKDGGGGGFLWSNFGTLSALSDKYFIIEAQNGTGSNMDIYDIQLMLYFSVPLPTEGYLANIDGYKDFSSGVLSGSGSTLIENPAHILNALSVFYAEKGGYDADVVDIDHNVDNLGPTRSAYKFARSIVDQDDFAEYIQTLGEEGLFWVTVNEEGKLKGVAWEDSGSPAEIEISPRDIVNGELDNYERTASKDVVSDFKFKYKYNHTRDDYDGLVFCNKDESSEELGSEYETICAWSEFNNGGKAGARVFEFDWVRDRATMIEIAKRMFDFYSGRRWSISMTGDLALVTSQVGDRLDLSQVATWPDNYPPEMLQAKYRISEVRLRSSRDLITIKASEVF